MKYFVTGGSGFIGSNFVDYLLETPETSVINYSRHTYAMNPKILQHLINESRYQFVAGDICNGIKLLDTLQQTKPDVIVHFAASTHVDRSFLYPEEFLQTNLYGTFTLLEALRSYEAQHLRFVYVSTDEVFGDVASKFCCETDPVAPRNPYSASKAAAELYVNTYFQCFNIQTVITRLMNNYGPRQHPEKLIAKMITRCLTDTPFTLFQGKSVRGWTYVKDACQAINLIAQKGVIGETYHVPPTTYKTVPEVTSAILTLMKKQSLFQGYKGRRLKDDERYALSGDKLTHTLGFHPPTSFKQGLQRTVEWYRENPWFWRDAYTP